MEGHEKDYTMTTAAQSSSRAAHPVPRANPIPLPSAAPDRTDRTSETAIVTRPKRRRALILLPALALLALGAGVTAYISGHGKESTDDAQVEGHVVSVSPRVAGQVARVLVKDNQPVHEGDVLVELDDRDLQTRLAAARADLASAKAQLHAARTQLAVTTKSAASELMVARATIEQAAANQSSSHAAIRQAEAEVTAAEARERLAATDFERMDRLYATNAVSRAQWDTVQATLAEAQAALVQKQAHLVSARAALSSSMGGTQAARGRLIAAQAGPEQIEAQRAQQELAEARVSQAQSAVDQAELSLSYAKIRAAVSGVVSRRTVEIGQTVSPDRPLLALIPLDDTWIVANFKEDQIAQMKKGQRAKVSVDTFGGRELIGHVDSLAGGTGSRFALLPPDNASGNFTKVVQRVPVLIHLEPQSDVTLRPGLSATVTVQTL
jgi:membrane fusion protein (multidrug efflux system)